MNLDKLEKIFQSEKPFRLKQAQQAIFKDLIEDWGEATILSLDLRQKLIEDCPLEIKAEVFVSGDQRSVKALIALADGLKIEAVLMRHQGRNTICVSSQIGCPLGCVFCATGQMGFKRNLIVGEIIEQVLFFARWLKKERESINNIVFMGMGEPFLNYDNVLAAIKIINDKDGFNIGSRHISVSTVGIVEGIEKFTNEILQVNLAISLHAPNDKLRSQLMPINKKYPLEEVLKGVARYIEKTNRKIMFEYVMIKGINDTEDCARQLLVLLEDLPRHLIMVNLIVYNWQRGRKENKFSFQTSEPISSFVYNPTGIFEASAPERVKKFKDILMKGGWQTVERFRFGQDIAGACGQLISN